MTRKWLARKCNECNQLPTANVTGIFVCSCGKTWAGLLGIEADEQEQEFLSINGFSTTVDRQGDVYYTGPYGHIIWLFPDDTWYSDKARDGSSMGEYLNWLSENLS
jgi:hypothetical protein